MIEFKMPALGSDMDEGTLNEWLIKPGDPVTRGQVVAVVETTKAAVEIECWQEGTVDQLLIPVGETVQVGTAMATLREPNDTAEPVPYRSMAPSEAPAAVEPDSAATASAPAAGPPATPPRRRFVSPAARRLAASLGIDVDTVTGTGPQQAVTIVDVEHAAAVAAQTVAKPALTDRAAEIRKAIAAAMSRSKREIPHYYLAHDIPMDTALGWLREHNAQRSITERLLPAVLQLKAVGLAAQRFGEFNGFWRDDGFAPSPGVHVGIAISLRGGGLVAPAIHDVPNKSLTELMANLTDLVARARAGSLRSSEMSDPSITITNLGDQGGDTVFGVIYPPQVALVGFGRPAPRVGVIDGGIRVITAVQASLAADHRATDGHRGARFLAEIHAMLQRPDDMEN